VAQSAGSALAAVARQARGLLGNLRESRWPGFDPVATADLPQPAALRPRGPVAPEWASLDEIAGSVAACTKCALHATRRQAVPGEGHPRARLMFVGEAPGEEEDAKGRPFVGAAGHLLDKMIVAMGLSRSDVFIANVLKCRPPGNRDPQGPEVAACLPYLRAQIALVRPEVVCALGRHAAHALLGGTDSLGRLRGRFHDFGGTPLLATYHPSYLLRTPDDKTKAWKDLQLVMQRLGLPLPAQRPEPEGNR
jgi:uracil-DNA glycosylase family 4